MNSFRHSFKCGELQFDGITMKSITRLSFESETSILVVAILFSALNVIGCGIGNSSASGTAKSGEAAAIAAGISDREVAALISKLPCDEFRWAAFRSGHTSTVFMTGKWRTEVIAEDEDVVDGLRTELLQFAEGSALSLFEMPSLDRRWVETLDRFQIGNSLSESHPVFRINGMHGQLGRSLNILVSSIDGQFVLEIHW